jgi:hypothetical protein
MMSGLGSLDNYSSVSVTLSNALSDFIWVSVPTSCFRSNWILDKERGILESKARHERHCCRQLSTRTIEGYAMSQHSTVASCRFVVIGEGNSSTTNCSIAAMSSHLAQCTNGRNQLSERSRYSGPKWWGLGKKEKDVFKMAIR